MKKTDSGVPRDLPVSRKYYLGMRARLHHALGLVGAQVMEPFAVQALDRCLRGEYRVEEETNLALKLVFAMVKDEIDKALARSAAARRRAQKRRAAREAEAGESAAGVVAAADAPAVPAGAVVHPAVPAEPEKKMVYGRDWRWGGSPALGVRKIILKSSPEFYTDQRYYPPL